MKDFLLSKGFEADDNGVYHLSDNGLTISIKMREKYPDISITLTYMGTYLNEYWVERTPNLDFAQVLDEAFGFFNEELQTIIERATNSINILPQLKEKFK